jgi:hypothetical protein
MATGHSISFCSRQLDALQEPVTISHTGVVSKAALRPDNGRDYLKKSCCTHDCVQQIAGCQHAPVHPSLCSRLALTDKKQKNMPTQPGSGDIRKSYKNNNFYSDAASRFDRRGKLPSFKQLFLKLPNLFTLINIT